MEQEKQLTSLPENAYRELKPGEEYTPIMPAFRTFPRFLLEPEQMIFR